VTRAQRDSLRDAWRAAGLYPDLTVGEAIARGATSHGDEALVFAPNEGAEVEVSLAELHAGALDVAGRLHGIGVRSGDAVVLQSASDLRSTQVAIALWALGAVVVPVVAAATPAELGHVVRETGVRTVVVAPTWRGVDLVAPALDLGVDNVVVLADDVPVGAMAVDALPTRRLPTIPRPRPWDVACILYTSGSTAAPKGVQHTHETLLFGLTVVPADSKTRMLATFPAGHVAALLGLLRPLVAGGTTVVMDRWSASRAAALIEEHRITASAGTPFFLATLLDEAERSGRDISSLDRFLCGAAAVPPALVERALAQDIVTWRTYGSTEHPAIAGGGPDDPPEKRQGTDGRITPLNEVRLVDEHGHDVAPGAEGQIIARGPRQFVGYRDSALDDDAFVDGTWFLTGDLARFDPDGYLIVTDRVKDIIIRGGENISAREVEEVLTRHGGIAEVAVCAAPDRLWGETVCAVVVPRGPAPSLEELRLHAEAAGLADHKCPSKLVVVDELPRTAAGKVRKRDLRPLL
jgi:cyclohexanecarboxylate-CoA ligase